METVSISIPVLTSCVYSLGGRTLCGFQVPDFDFDAEALKRFTERRQGDLHIRYV